MLSPRCGAAARAQIAAVRRGISAKYPIPIPFFCSHDGHDYVRSLSCLRFRLPWLGFGRDGIAHIGPHPEKSEKVRVHSPLGNLNDLARHLILSTRLYPRSELLRVVNLSQIRPVASRPGPSGDRTHENCYGDHQAIQARRSPGRPDRHRRSRTNGDGSQGIWRSEEHTSELQSHSDLVCRLLLEKKKKKY